MRTLLQILYLIFSFLFLLSSVTKKRKVYCAFNIRHCFAAVSGYTDCQVVNIGCCLRACIPELAGLRLMCLSASFMPIPPHKRVKQRLTAIHSVFVRFLLSIFSGMAHYFIFARFLFGAIYINRIM